MAATVFIQFETQSKTNPVEMAIAQIAKAAGGQVVDKLVDEKEVEANIAVTNKVEVALRIIKETENTLVFLGSLGSTGYCSNRAEAMAFASRFPDRVMTGSLVGEIDEENFVTKLMQTIMTMGKETE